MSKYKKRLLVILYVISTIIIQCTPVLAIELVGTSSMMDKNEERMSSQSALNSKELVSEEEEKAVGELISIKYKGEYRDVDYKTPNEQILIGKNHMNDTIIPAGSVGGGKLFDKDQAYSSSNGYYAKYRIIDFKKLMTPDNFTEIVVGTHTDGGTVITISSSLNGEEWNNLGYIKIKDFEVVKGTFAYDHRYEYNHIKSIDIPKMNKFRYLKVEVTKAVNTYHTCAIDFFYVYGDQEKFEPSRMIGIEYEQTVDIDNNTSLPKIIEVKAEIEDQTTNTYKLSIEDFKCDVNGIPFFFWKADEVMFIGANEDYTEVRCIIDEGISGRKVPVKVYIGDALGHIGKYTVWLSSN